MIGLTWNSDTLYATGRDTTSDAGITDKGRELLNMIVQKKNVILDIAHLSERGVLDLADIYKGPIIASHGNLNSVYPNKRNFTDDEISIVTERNGVVGLFLVSSFTGPNGTMEDLWKHVHYFINKWGIDYLGITPDLYPIPAYPYLEGFTNETILNRVKEFLLTKLSEHDVEKIMYTNWKRVLEQL